MPKVNCRIGSIKAESYNKSEHFINVTIYLSSVDEKCCKIYTKEVEKMVINRKHLAKAKIEQLKNGFSAFAETSEVAFHIERELQNLNINVHIDRTPMGAWFIPIKADG